MRSTTGEPRTIKFFRKLLYPSEAVRRQCCLPVQELMMIDEHVKNFSLVLDEINWLLGKEKKIDISVRVTESHLILT